MPGIGIGIGLPFRRNIATTPAVPSGLSASFTVNTISGDLTWTDNSAGKAQYEIYSSTNGGDYALLTTTSVGATSYSDTTCKQNASVVYRIRAKKGILYSDYVTATALVTPLCWKTDQTVRTNVVINALNTNNGKTINVDWGDGTNTNYTGSNYNITKIYDASEVNIFNIKITGDINEIVSLQHYNQLKSYGNLTNWVLPSEMVYFRISGNNFTGELFDITSKCTTYWVYNNQFTGNTPEIIDAEVGLDARLYGNKITGCATAHFRKAMTMFDVSNQTDYFSLLGVNTLFENLANYYDINTPSQNCSFLLSGSFNYAPTDGILNPNYIEVQSYYSNASKTATISISNIWLLNIATVSESILSLTWRDNVYNADYISIERSIDGVNFSEVATVDYGEELYLNTQLTSGTKYYYRIRGSKNNTFNEYSNIVSTATIESRNTDIVVSANYLTVDNTGASYNIPTTGRWFINKNNNSRIRQNGNIVSLQFYLSSKATSTLYFQVWRKVGSYYDLVGEEDIFSKVTAGQVNDVTLITPISVIEGDYIGIGGSGGTGNSVILGKNQGTAASMYYYSGAKPSTSQFDFDSKTAQTYAIPIKINMQAPLIVLIGDSIIAGHPAHYSYIENSLTSVLLNQIGSQLLALNSYNIYQNMGYGGQTTTQILARFTADVVNLKPKYVIIDGGVNDIAGGVIDKATYLGNIEDMLDLCVTADIKAIVCKIMPWIGGTNEQMVIRDEWNADLETLVNTYSNAICIDFDNYVGVFRVGGAEGNLWNINPLYAAGDVHYNLAGYRKIAETIYSFMYF